RGQVVGRAPLVVDVADGRLTAAPLGRWKPDTSRSWRHMEKIAHRTLGTKGLSVSAIGLGCMSLSGVYGAADDAESENLIRSAIDKGVDHLDSSDMYGW